MGHLDGKLLLAQFALVAGIFLHFSPPILADIDPPIPRIDELSLLEDRRKCEPITVPICKDIGYNFTRMPNLVRNENQQEAEHQLDTFKPLIQVKCSSQLKFFLCSVYVPMCTDMVVNSIGPCRPLCESVQKRCEPVLKQVGFSWPPSLNCSLFPAENNAKSMCMKGPEEPETVKIPDFGNPPPPQDSEPQLMLPPIPDFPNPFPVGATGPSPTKYCPLSRKWKNSRFIYINSTGRCAPLCNQELLFTPKQEQTVLIWMGTFSGLCLLLTLTSLFAALTSSIRFNYPERAILFIVFCSGMACIGHMIRLFSGHSNVACTDYGQASVFVIQGVQNLRCTVIFLFQYYFTLVSSIWWLIFCGSWCLMVGLNWSAENIEHKTSCLHFIAWALPGALTVVILVRQSVEADELTGMCNVGNVNTKEMLYFFILPHLICVATGALCLILGFGLSVFCSANVAAKRGGLLWRDTPTTISESVADPMLAPSNGGAGKNRFSSPVACVGEGGAGSTKMDNLSLKLGLLAVFYIVPWTCIFAAGFHEYFYRSEWMPTVTLSQLQAQGAFHASPNGDPSSVPLSPESPTQAQPSFPTFILKTVASLIFGLAASLWLLGRLSHHFLCLNAAAAQAKRVPEVVSNANSSAYCHQGGAFVGSNMVPGLHSYAGKPPNFHAPPNFAMDKRTQNLMKQYIPLNGGHAYGNTII